MPSRLRGPPSSLSRGKESLPIAISPIQSPGGTVNIETSETIVPLVDQDIGRKFILSLRAPSSESSAAEILATNNHLKHVQPMLLDVKEALSEFGSCVSSQSSSSSDSEEDHLVEKRIQGWEMKSRRKRKPSSTPHRDHFLKKQNTDASPTSSLVVTGQL